MGKVSSSGESLFSRAEKPFMPSIFGKDLTRGPAKNSHVRENARTLRRLRARVLEEVLDPYADRPRRAPTASVDSFECLPAGGYRAGQRALTESPESSKWLLVRLTTKSPHQGAHATPTVH